MRHHLLPSRATAGEQCSVASGLLEDAVQTLSVVLPAFNEEDNIALSVGRARDVLERLVAKGTLTGWEIVVVDDGSRDATARVMERRFGQDGRVRLLRHKQNRGYGAALRTGIRSARHDGIFFTDADLQFDLAEVVGLLRFADRYDIIAGYRVGRQDPVHRRLNALAWGALVNTLFDLDIRDVNCAFKLFHRRVFDKVDMRSIGAFVNTEILARARHAGFSVHQVPVRHYPRPAGEATGANPRVVLRAFVELARMHRDLRGRAPEAVRPADLAMEPAPAVR